MDDNQLNLPENARLIDKVMLWVFRLAGLCMLSLMGLVFVSVIFRYFLNRPIFAVEDVMSVFLGLTIFMAFPFVTMGRTHINVDLLVPLFKRAPALNRLRLALVDLGILGMVAFTGWQLYRQADRHFSRGSSTQAADIPLWPFSATFTILVALAFLAFAVVALRDWRAAEPGGGEDPS